MIGEIAVIPQFERSGRSVIEHAVDAIAGEGLRHEVGAGGTSVEGELEEILGAVRAIAERLRSDGVERAVIDLRLQLEPHPETLEHQVEGIRRRETHAVHVERGLEGEPVLVHDR